MEKFRHLRIFFGSNRCHVEDHHAKTLSALYELEDPNLRVKNPESYAWFALLTWIRDRGYRLSSNQHDAAEGRLVRGPQDRPAVKRYAELWKAWGWSSAGSIRSWMSQALTQVWCVALGLACLWLNISEMAATGCLF